MARGAALPSLRARSARTTAHCRSLCVALRVRPGQGRHHRHPPNRQWFRLTGKYIFYFFCKIANRPRGAASRKSALECNCQLNYAINVPEPSPATQNGFLNQHTKGYYAESRAFHDRACVCVPKIPLVPSRVIVWIVWSSFSIPKCGGRSLVVRGGTTRERGWS